MIAALPWRSMLQRTVPGMELFVACIETGFEKGNWLAANANSGVADSRTDDQPFVRQWIQASLNGDGPAFQQIVIHYQNMISRRMWKFTRDRNAHEELVQDVFVDAFLSLASFRGTAPFEHWLQTIATRIGYRHWKARRSTERLSEAQLHSLVSRDGDRARSAAEAGELVHYLLAQLSAPDRLVLTLMSLEGCSVAETARLTGWNQALVKVRAYRARRKLEALWKRIASIELGTKT